MWISGSLRWSRLITPWVSPSNTVVHNGSYYSSFLTRQPALPTPRQISTSHQETIIVVADLLSYCFLHAKIYRNRLNTIHGLAKPNIRISLDDMIKIVGEAKLLKLIGYIASDYGTFIYWRQGLRWMEKFCWASSRRFIRQNVSHTLEQQSE